MLGYNALMYQKYRFSIEVKHFNGGVGAENIYLINDKYVQVETNCDFQDCDRKIVYKRKLSRIQSDSIFHLLKSLRLDTLKENYRPARIVLDGLESSSTFRGSRLKNKTVYINNRNIKATDSLYSIIDKFILNKKYKFTR